jgi:mono/diheme cytochrome c family protein
MITLILRLVLVLNGLGNPSQHRTVSAQDEHDQKAGSPTRSVWDGVYSDAQSKRGQTAYLEECARCHSETLSGAEGSPALAGDAFLDKWKGATLNDLFERIRTTMPADSPGRLGRGQCVDILAYILNVNKFPAGQNDLERDAAALQKIQIRIHR